MKITISLAQIQPVYGNPDENFEKAQVFISHAAQKSADLILFPELWSSGYNLKNRSTLSEANKKLSVELSNLATQHNIWIGGTLIKKIGASYYNVFQLHAPSLANPVEYAKAHLFRLMNEDEYFASGKELQIASTPWGNTGLAICYDLRFPELFRKYALMGTKLILICAEWPQKRIDHWKTLLRARAIENQTYIAAVNAVGPIHGETFGGNSMLIDPWGNVLAAGHLNQETLVTGQIDLDTVEEIRKKIPILKDRRPDIYGNFSPID